MSRAPDTLDIEIIVEPVALTDDAIDALARLLVEAALRGDGAEEGSTESELNGG